MRFHSRLGLGLWFLAIAGAPTLLRGQSPAPPSLGAAASFAVLGGSSVTSAGSTVVTGNLGVSPGNAISGSIAVKVGATYRNDSVARQAQRDATSAYNELAGRTCTNSLSTNLGGMTLGPGVYCFSSSAQLTGTLILDAANDPNAVWIFRIGSTLTTTAGSSVVVTNGGWNGNVFFQVGGSATLNASTAFVGNIFALTDITLRNGASVSGRLLARGAVALDNNDVSLCPCDPISLLPATLPNGSVCTPYGTVTFSASGGSGQYSFSAPSGDLPPGLVLTGGVLSGTPTKKGTFPVTVTATDANGCSGNRLYVIDIGCPPVDPPIPLPSAKACELYCQKIAPSCGNEQHMFSALPGALPAGLILSSDGMLCGTPTTPGDYTFIITDETSGCPRRYFLQVVCNVTISPATLPNGTVGTPYPSLTITGSCGPVPCVVTGTLPPGLTLLDCIISGTPTTTGCFQFTVTMTYANGCSRSIVYTICVDPCPITVSPPTLPDGSVCVPYSQTITASCAAAPYICSLTDGMLPQGLSLANCTISGIPTAAGLTMFTITVTDANSKSGFRNYKLLVTPGVVLSPATLPAGTPGVPYNEVITASGGTAPYTFVVSGSLPPGLILTPTPTTATISGTPTTVGCFPFTVTVTDANGCATSVTYTICVAAGGPALSGWGIILLSVLLVGAGFVMMRRGGV
jgi:hypothetical protein